MRKLFSFLLVICLLAGLVFAMSFAAFAEDGGDVYVIDKSGLLDDYDVFKYDVVLKEMSDERSEDLLILIVDEDSAAELADEYGVEADAESSYYLQGIAESYYDENGRGCGDDDSGILVLMRTGEPYEDHIYVCTTGDMYGEFGDDDIEKLIGSAEPYLNEDDISGAVSACISAEEAFFTGYRDENIAALAEEFTGDDIPAEGEPGYRHIIDMTGSLSSSDLDRFEKELTDLGNEYSEDLVIVIVDTQIAEILNEKYRQAAPYGYNYSLQGIADYIYDNNGYGYGAQKSGLLTLLRIGEPYSNHFHLCTSGDLIAECSESDIDDIYYATKPGLSSENIARAVDGCISAEENFLKKVQDSKGFHPAAKGFISAAIGAVVGAISTFSMKGKLKSVTRQTRAEGYVVPGSFELRDSRDLFLYSNVTRTAKPQTDARGGGGGGAGFHISSSGVSHGGGTR